MNRPSAFLQLSAVAAAALSVDLFLGHRQAKTEAQLGERRKAGCEHVARKDRKNPNRLGLHKRKATELLLRAKEEIGTPGLVAAVSVGGRVVYARGFGYADVENLVPIGPESLIRVASISKTMTMVAVGMLVDQGIIDLDKPVSGYIEYPPPTVSTNTQLPQQNTNTTPQGKNLTNNNTKAKNNNNQGNKEKDTKPNQVNTENGKKNTGGGMENGKDSVVISDEKMKRTITVRQLAAHLSGIRHYKEPEKESTKKEGKEGEVRTEMGDPAFPEFLDKTFYPTVNDAVKVFASDPLVHPPGEKYLYSTHGWTLISAVIEKVTGTSFLDHMDSKVFKAIGLNNTCADVHEKILPNRVHCYRRTEKGRLENAPWVDLSMKWAGGGFLSTPLDLLTFGQSILACELMSPQITRRCWETCTDNSGKATGYGMGFKVIQEAVLERPGVGVVQSEQPPNGEHTETKAHSVKRRKVNPLIVGHSGGAVGASSHLFIVPEYDMVVVVLANLEGVSLQALALQLVDIFRPRSIRRHVS